MIYFKNDEKSMHYKEFEISGNQCVIKKIGKGKNHLILCHHEPLQKNAKFYFKVKIVHTTNRIVLIGICGKDIR